MTKLKPCPFCGGTAEFERTGSRQHSCIVVCCSCGARHESGDEDDRSGTSWNCRHTEAEAYRAGELAMRERAAKECETYGEDAEDRYPDDVSLTLAADDCRDAIRSLPIGVE